MPSSDTSTPTPESLLSAADVARILGREVRHVHRLATTGVLPPDCVWTRGSQDIALWLPETVAQYTAPVAHEPEPLPRVPGSRWRMKACQVCGTAFDPPGPNSKWCGDPCRDAVRAEREAGR